MQDLLCVLSVRKEGEVRCYNTTDVILQFSHQWGSIEWAAGLHVWELSRGRFRFRAGRGRGAMKHPIL